MINRFNYEEFFLLYVDDELNVQQRTAVELFVQQNPDLATEFEMLLQTKAYANDAITFPDKNALLKATSVEINSSNYETYFLLYADNELNAGDKKEVEKFVLQHPQLQQEFTLLMQTVLQPEIVVFTNKETLYRKEEKRRVVPIYLLRIAVAAAFIGVALFVWWLASSGSQNNVATVSPEKKITLPVTKQQDVASTIDTQKQKNDVAITQLTENKSNNKPENIVVKKQQQQIIKTLPEQNIVAQNNSLNNERVATNNLQPQQIISTKKDVTANIGSTTAKEITQPVNELPVETAKTIYAVNDNNYNPQPVAYKVLETDNQKNSLYIGSLELNKNKVRGFFKKAGQFFSGKAKNNNDDAGKLQVANMQIITN